MRPTICPVCGASEFNAEKNGCRCAYCNAFYKTEEKKTSEEETILLTTAYDTLRRQEFFEAEEMFENIIEKYPKSEKAYWGIACAKYGIKYVDDDFSKKKIPTFCFPQEGEFSKDKNVLKAIELSDDTSISWYKEQMRYIDNVEKSTLKKPQRKTIMFSSATKRQMKTERRQRIA